MVEKTLADFFEELVGISPEKEPTPPIAADDITVTCCRECPFQEDIQNSWTHSCRLISYSTILNNSKIMSNCPLQLKSINVSLDRSKIKEWKIKNLQ